MTADKQKLAAMDKDAVAYIRKGVAKWGKGDRAGGDAHIRAANALDQKIDNLRGNAGKGD